MMLLDFIKCFYILSTISVISSGDIFENVENSKNYQANSHEEFGENSESFISEMDYPSVHLTSSRSRHLTEELPHIGKQQKVRKLDIMQNLENLNMDANPLSDDNFKLVFSKAVYKVVSDAGVLSGNSILNFYASDIAYVTLLDNRRRALTTLSSKSLIYDIYLYLSPDRDYDAAAVDSKCTAIGNALTAAGNNGQFAGAFNTTAALYNVTTYTDLYVSTTVSNPACLETYFIGIVPDDFERFDYNGYTVQQLVDNVDPAYVFSGKGFYQLYEIYSKALVPYFINFRYYDVIHFAILPYSNTSVLLNYDFQIGLTSLDDRNKFFSLLEGKLNSDLPAINRLGYLTTDVRNKTTSDMQSYIGNISITDAPMFPQGNSYESNLDAFFGTHNMSSVTYTNQNKVVMTLPLTISTQMVQYQSSLVLLDYQPPRIMILIGVNDVTDTFGRDIYIIGETLRTLLPSPYNTTIISDYNFEVMDPPSGDDDGGDDYRRRLYSAFDTSTSTSTSTSATIYQRKLQSSTTNRVLRYSIDIIPICGSSNITCHLYAADRIKTILTTAYGNGQFVDRLNAVKTLINDSNYESTVVLESSKPPVVYLANHPPDINGVLLVKQPMSNMPTLSTISDTDMTTFKKAFASVIRSLLFEITYYDISVISVTSDEIEYHISLHANGTYIDAYSNLFQNGLLHAVSNSDFNDLLQIAISKYYYHVPQFDSIETSSSSDPLFTTESKSTDDNIIRDQSEKLVSNITVTQEIRDIDLDRLSDATGFENFKSILRKSIKKVLFGIRSEDITVHGFRQISRRRVVRRSLVTNGNIEANYTISLYSSSTDPNVANNLATSTTTTLSNAIDGGSLANAFVEEASNSNEPTLAVANFASGPTVTTTTFSNTPSTNTQPADKKKKSFSLIREAGIAVLVLVIILIPLVLIGLGIYYVFFMTAKPAEFNGEIHIDDVSQVKTFDDRDSVVQSHVKNS